MRVLIMLVDTIQTGLLTALVAIANLVAYFAVVSRRRLSSGLSLLTSAFSYQNNRT